MRRSVNLIIVTLTAALCVVCVPSVSLAETYGARPPGGGLVENPDGTWSLWGEASSKTPLEIYTSAEKDLMLQEYAGVTADAGVTGQTAADVPGATTASETAADEIFKNLATGKLYTGPSEGEVGQEFIDRMIAEGVFPDLGEEFSVAATAPEVIAGIGTAGLGVVIGTGIDDLLGWPSFFDMEGEESGAPAGIKYGPPGAINEKTFSAWGVGGRFQGHVEECRLIVGSYFESEVNPKEPCVGFGHKGYKDGYTAENLECKGETCEWVEEVQSFNSPTYVEAFSDGYNLPCPESNGPAKCAYKVESGKHYGFFYVPLGKNTQIHRLAFPGKGLNELEMWEKNMEGPGVKLSTIAPVEPAKLTPPLPTEVPTKVEEDIGNNQKKKSLPGVPLFPGEKEREIPDPKLPEIPRPSPNETAPEYVKHLEEEGWEHVEETTRPENDTNPQVGPEGVAAVSPEPGTHTELSTKVRVEANPKDAAAPETGGGIGPPTQPGIKLPNFGVLCKVFPFGVPCWLIEEISAWSATAKAPVWGISSMTIMGRTIPGASFNLAKLEPIMTVVRPAILVFATIGLVLLFYNFATGGGSPSGSQGDSDNSSVPQPDNDVYL